MARYGALGLVMLLLSIARPLSAQDASVRVDDSVFNSFANQLEPLTLTGYYSYQVSTWFGNVTYICSSNWTATVTGITFSTSPGITQITGSVDASWCNVGFHAPLLTTANVTYSGGNIWISVNPTYIQPVVNVLGIEHQPLLPVTIDVSSALYTAAVAHQYRSFFF